MYRPAALTSLPEWKVCTNYNFILTYKAVSQHEETCQHAPVGAGYESQIGHAEEYGDLLNLSRTHPNDGATGEGAPQGCRQHGDFGEERDSSPPTPSAKHCSGERSGSEALRGPGTKIQGQTRGLHASHEVAEATQGRPGRYGRHRVCRQGRRVTASETSRSNPRAVRLGGGRHLGQGGTEKVCDAVTPRLHIEPTAVFAFDALS